MIRLSDSGKRPPCSAFAARLKNNEQPVSITLYPGAYHDFDNPAGKLRVRSEVPNGVNAGKGVTVAMSVACGAGKRSVPMPCGPRNG